MNRSRPLVTIWTVGLMFASVFTFTAIAHDDDVVPHEGHDPLDEQIRAVELGIRDGMVALNGTVATINQTMQGNLTGWVVFDPLATDIDQDGIPDVWRLRWWVKPDCVQTTCPAANTGMSYVSGDLVYGPAHDRRAMVAHPTSGALSITGLNATYDGTTLTLTVERGDEEPVDLYQVIAAPDGLHKLVLRVLDPTRRYHSTSNAPLWPVPIDLGYVVLLPPSDLDGDGASNIAEMFPAAPAASSHPLNPLSVPGDSDGDGCFTNKDVNGRRETSVDDQKPATNPCLVFPHIPSVDAVIDSKVTDALGNTVWDDFDIKVTTASNPSFPVGPAVASWSVFAVPPATLTPRTTLCTGTSADLPGSTPTTCPARANRWSDGDQRAIFEICYVDGKCAQSLPVLFTVKDRPTIDGSAFVDLVTTDNHRANWISGTVTVQVKALHPGRDITKIILTPRAFQTPAEGSTLLQQNFPPLTIPVSDPAVELVDASQGLFKITLDSSLFPQFADMPNKGNGPAGFLGFRLKLEAKRDAGAYGEVSTPVAEKMWPAVPTYLKVFNNNEPLVTTNTPTVAQVAQGDKNRTVTFQVHYKDLDWSAPSSVKVRVDGEDVNCLRAGRPKLLGTSIENPNSDPPPAYDADYLCTWNALARRGSFGWSVTAIDPDGGPNSRTVAVAATDPHALRIVDGAPTLSGGTATINEAKSFTSDGMPVDFRVTYNDTRDSPAYVRVVAANATETTRSDLAVCPESIRVAVPNSAPPPPRADYCGTLSFPDGDHRSIHFEAVDVRGDATRHPADPSDDLQVDIALPCRQCADKGTVFVPLRQQGDAAIAALNGALAGRSVPGYGDIPGLEDVADSDGDLVPDVVESWILKTDILDAGDGSPEIRDEWNVTLYKPGSGVGVAEFPLVTLTFSESSRLYSVRVCSTASACTVRDQEVSFVSYRSTRDAVVIEAFDAAGAKVFRQYANTTRFGSASAYFLQIEVHSGPSHMLLDVSSDPFNVGWYGTGSFASLGNSDLYSYAFREQTSSTKTPTNPNLGPYSNVPLYETKKTDEGFVVCFLADPALCSPPVPDTLPRVGAIRDDGGDIVFYVDPDNSGERILISPDAGLDGDTDGVPDPLEATICTYVEVPDNPFYNDGRCDGDDYIPPADPLGRDEG